MDLATQRIAVTGAGEFLGGRVVEHLRARGCEAVAIEADLRKNEALRGFLAEAKPDLVLHLAGYPGEDGAEPATAFYQNALTGLNVLHESWKAGVKKLVTLASACAYPEFAPVPLREEDLWNGAPEAATAAFGFAKKLLLVQAQAYRRQHGFDAVVLVPGTLYGPGDDTGGLIGRMIRTFVETRDAGESRVTFDGDGSPTRDFLHVDDCAEAILLAAERYDGADPMNVGSGWEIPLSDLVTKISSLVGFPGRVAWDASKPNGQPRRRLDVTRAQRELGFRARVSLDDGLAETIRWFEESRGAAQA